MPSAMPVRGPVELHWSHTRPAGVGAACASSPTRTPRRGRWRRWRYPGCGNGAECSSIPRSRNCGSTRECRARESSMAADTQWSSTSSTSATGRKSGLGYTSPDAHRTTCRPSRYVKASRRIASDQLERIRGCRVSPNPSASTRLEHSQNGSSRSRAAAHVLHPPENIRNETR